MKGVHKLTCLLLFAILISCTSSQKKDERNIDNALDILFEGYMKLQYETFPEYASYEGNHEYSDQLTDQSLNGKRIYTTKIQMFKNTIETFKRDKFSEPYQLNYDLLNYQLDQIIDDYELKVGNYLELSQQNGYHIYFPQIVEYQPLETDLDVSNYFSRLNKFKLETSRLINNLKEGQKEGVVLSCNITKQVLAQLKGFAEIKTEDSPLYKVIEKSEALQNRKDELITAIDSVITPSYIRLYEYYKNEYHPNCREEVGISSVNGGKAYYEYLIRKYTTSDQLPEEVFKIGENEVARIKKEIKLVQKELGYAELSLTDFYTELKTNPKYYFDQKEDLLNGFREILKRMDAKLPELFGKLPKTPYDLKEIEAYRAKAAPAAYYYSAPDDGSRPGYFYVNTYDLSSRPKYTMTALALHEAVPGHHLQIALAKEMENVPWFRKQMSVTAFVEGWGLYAEHLGYETGMYKDPIQKIGALTFEMWRACRLVVDVGIHYKGWTRDQAIDYMKSNLPLSDLDVQSEIDRYISWPGQAVAYKTGELKLKELRSKAESKLGEKFDLKAFHDTVLKNGSIPLSLLEKNINAWIESQL